MESKRSLNVTLRISNIPDAALNDIKGMALQFKQEVNSVVKAVKLTDDVYYDFNITESEWIDEELYDGEYRSHRRNGRRIG